MLSGILLILVNSNFLKIILDFKKLVVLIFWGKNRIKELLVQVISESVKKLVIFMKEEGIYIFKEYGNNA
jgi:hypothetical protein